MLLRVLLYGQSAKNNPLKGMVKKMSGILEAAAGATVPVLCVMIFASGGYFAALLRLYPFRRPCRLARVFFPAGRGLRDNLSSLKAMTLALAGTLGVGNIVGVASALVEGGRGALFWMWVSALFAAVVKYAEIVAAVRTRRCETIPGEGRVYHGGAMYYIKNRHAASLFAVLIIFGSFFIGNILQVKAAGEAVGTVFGVPEIYTSSLIAFVCCIILVGGGKRISGFTAVLIPLLALCYIGASLYIICREASALPSALASVLRDAVSPASVGIGGAGCTMWSAMRYGITRGLFSSEAGCGSAPIAHAEAHCHSPAEQGCYGIFEVFADTSLLCTLSALVIILSPDTALSAGGDYGTGIDLVIAAFSARLGSTAGLFISVSVALFALAALVCWAHYATEAIGYLRRCIRHEKERGESNTPTSRGIKGTLTPRDVKSTFAPHGTNRTLAPHGTKLPPDTGAADGVKYSLAAESSNNTKHGESYSGTCDKARNGAYGSRKKLLPRADAVYILIYCTAAALSVRISGSVIWSLADLSLAAMTIINLIALIPERKQIAALTFRVFSRRRYKRLYRDNETAAARKSPMGTAAAHKNSTAAAAASRNTASAAASHTENTRFEQRRVLCAHSEKNG